MKGNITRKVQGQKYEHVAGGTLSLNDNFLLSLQLHLNAVRSQCRMDVVACTEMHRELGWGLSSGLGGWLSSWVASWLEG